MEIVAGSMPGWPLGWLTAGPPGSPLGVMASRGLLLEPDKEGRAPMSNINSNKFRVAVEVLQRGRDSLVEGIADDLIDQGDDLVVDGGYMFNEFLENQGTRLHFLSLLIQQLEQSAESLDEAQTPPPPPPSMPAKKPRKPRAKKLTSQRAEKSQEDA